MNNFNTNTYERNRASPDPASHAANLYDIESDMLDEIDDDMDFEPTTEYSDENEFFEATEDDDDEYHGTDQRS